VHGEPERGEKKKIKEKKKGEEKKQKGVNLDDGLEKIKEVVTIDFWIHVLNSLKNSFKTALFSIVVD
jgi:hypothetical protein